MLDLLEILGSILDWKINIAVNFWLTVLSYFWLLIDMAISMWAVGFKLYFWFNLWFMTLFCFRLFMCSISFFGVSISALKGFFHIISSTIKTCSFWFTHCSRCRVYASCHFHHQQNSCSSGQRQFRKSLVCGKSLGVRNHFPSTLQVPVTNRHMTC